MAHLVVTQPGVRVIVVDHGFRGGRGQGVPKGGALDPRALDLLNGLLGNAPGAAALEWALIPPCLRAEGGALQLALSGNVTGTIEGRILRPWQSFTLAEGQELTLTSVPPAATGLIAIAGGVTVPEILGSRSTSLAAGFGGLNGRALQEGDRIPCTAAPSASERLLTPPPTPDDPIRLVAGPQSDAFTPEALAILTGAPWRVTPQADRMGLRLEGPDLSFAPDRGPDIISDGIVPGAIQVPGGGQPIVLLADAQTTGGYTKIGCVIRADLWRLAHALPGDELRFVWVTTAEAEAAARAQAEAITHAITTAQTLHGPESLASANLAGAAVDAARPDHFPGQIEGESPCA